MKMRDARAAAIKKGAEGTKRSTDYAD